MDILRILANYLHMEVVSSERGQWSQRASMAVRGMVAAVRRSDTARLMIKIFLWKSKSCNESIMWGTISIKVLWLAIIHLVLYTSFLFVKETMRFMLRRTKKVKINILNNRKYNLYKTCENCNWDIWRQNICEANIIHRLGGQIVLCKVNKIIGRIVNQRRRIMKWIGTKYMDLRKQEEVCRAPVKVEYLQLPCQY